MTKLISASIVALFLLTACGVETHTPSITVIPEKEPQAFLEGTIGDIFVSHNAALTKSEEGVEILVVEEDFAAMVYIVVDKERALECSGPNEFSWSTDQPTEVMLTEVEEGRVTFTTENTHGWFLR